MIYDDLQRLVGDHDTTIQILLETLGHTHQEVANLRTRVQMLEDLLTEDKVSVEGGPHVESIE